MSTAQAPERDRGGTPPRSPRPGGGRLGGLAAGGSPAGLVLKLVLLAAVNGYALVLLPALIGARAWLGLAFLVAATLAIDWVYLSRKRIPLKYLLPGTLFLLAFQMYPVLYTGYIAFTNYGTGNILTKEQAVTRIETDSITVPPDATRYAVVPMAAGGDGELALLLTDEEGNVFLGAPDGLSPVEEAGEIRTEGEQIVGVGDYERLNLGQAQDRQQELQDFRVPTEDGEVRLQTFTTAARAEALRQYDPETDTLVDLASGEVYTPAGGFFVNEAGEALSPGWRVVVGPDNFLRAVTSPLIRGPFVRVFVWTYVFALGTVALTFGLGLGLAIALNHPDLAGKRIYRSLLVVPYALPSFLTALIWAGMLNQQFGVVNRMLGASIPWLVDPTMAKVSILLVNMWLGFPYMFLVTTGALQAIPGEVKEAAAVDGASAFAAFRRVTLPLLLVAVSPLLIASFAFNFNNFNTIYFVTQGGPPIVGARTPAGHSDILISYVYRIAFESGRGADYGFAAAISVLIFIMVAGISAFSFRYTRSLEELN
ncbi:MAG: maltose ABC transporter permease MalF [Euzebyaceae bacterium]|nr:maltose ABC transporter permease MalF [Euzebyaceae bacterium]